MTAKTEAAIIKNNLKLRQHPTTKEWEVYTTAHGTGIFRWFKISESTKLWYQTHFPNIKEVPYEN